MVTQIAIIVPKKIIGDSIAYLALNQTLVLITNVTGYY